MTESFNVIALISGGKDSFFSLLHCLENGHKIVALGNLYPPSSLDLDQNENKDDSDMNSFMYQTVGHMVIPQYEKALDIPLYREPIIGTALHTGASYQDSDQEYSCSSVSTSSPYKCDETECLVPLLKRIMNEHPNANAVSTGAIYSTYQRTRIENVARRLGLVSLSFLWQYPLLSLKNSTSLIEDMHSAKIEARIIKVAGSGLDENFLWQNLTSKSTLKKVQKAVQKFGVEDDGAILGEGGEFETLVLDGPSHLFKSRIEILDRDKIIVRENGGSAWLKILKAQVISKNNVSLDEIIRIPDILEPKFCGIFEILKDSVKYDTNFKFHELEGFGSLLHSPQPVPKKSHASSTLRWIISAPTGLKNVNEEAKCLIDTISSRLDRAGLTSTDVVSTILLLRSMRYFELINEAYGTFFYKPNPPARVTISCGDRMPPEVNIIIHLTISSSSFSTRKRKFRNGLHVQSYSYWAPANIGPYSQAITTKIDDEDSDLCMASISGQIPLIPHTMKLPTLEITSHPVAFQVTLSLQHLWRIGLALKVKWWTSVIAYLPHDATSTSKNIPEVAMLASEGWKNLHVYQELKEAEEEDESEVPDLWEQKHHAGMQIRGRRATPFRNILPDWSLLKTCSHNEDWHTNSLSPFFAIEVEELPRASAIEWHAQLGIIPGSSQVNISCHETQDQLNRWTIYQCIFGDDAMHIIIAIQIMEDIQQLYTCLRQAQSSLGLISSNDVDSKQDLPLPSVDLKDNCVNTTITHRGLSYQDASISQKHNLIYDHTVIPCSRIWDAKGQRLGYLWIYNTL
ncbi:hypothetical protein EPUL_003884 [Erysiphe pulchra]|uniref:Diphthine--ammonia ligase n=1 Tax=Erysiphe pulchra TaxID=225359 RepID=A0A2S4PZS2_9PEZI|nr:hypothetical protein EPUL_003884 [Erysiphe pulchra]